jgi:hypothetical protein
MNNKFIWPYACILLLAVMTFSVASCGEASESVAFRHPMTGLTAQETYERAKELFQTGEFYVDEQQEEKFPKRVAFIRTFIEDFVSGNDIEIIEPVRMAHHHLDDRAKQIKLCNRPQTSSNIFYGYYQTGPAYGPYVFYDIEIDGKEFLIAELFNYVAQEYPGEFKLQKSISELYRNHRVYIIKKPIVDRACEYSFISLGMFSGGRDHPNSGTTFGLIKYKGVFYYYYTDLHGMRIDVGIDALQKKHPFRREHYSFLRFLPTPTNERKQP